MSNADLKQKVKEKLFAVISEQIDLIGYVPADLAKLVQGESFDVEGHASPVFDEAALGNASEGGQGGAARAAGTGVEEAAGAGGPAALARKVNAYYDEAFYNPHGIMGQMLEGTEFRNIGYWDERTTNQKEASERLFDVLLASIPEKKGCILDVACGMGASTRRLLNHFPADQVHAINISERQIESTRANAPGVHAQVMNAVDLRFSNESFDNILCIEAAFHFETRRKFLEEAHRVLKSGGRLVLSDVLFTSRERLAQFPTFPSPENHIATVAEYEALLRSVGFREVMVKDAFDAIWPPHYKNALAKIHEDLHHGRLNLVQVTRILWSYYLLDAITGPCLLVCAQK